MFNAWISVACDNIAVYLLEIAVVTRSSTQIADPFVFLEEFVQSHIIVSLRFNDVSSRSSLS